MACWLRQSTAVDVMLGPCLDSTDGNSPETTLTITQPDIRLSKNGGAFAQKSAAQTLTHGENGWYPANLSTTDTNTLGILIVALHESGALPVWREFMVVPAQVYDSFFSTDFLQVDLREWSGLAPNGLSAGRVQSLAVSVSNDAITSTSFQAGSITATAIASDAITAAKVADGTIDAATFAAGAINAAAIAAGAIDNDALATDTDGYGAKMWVIKQGTTMDRYGVSFHKNGQPVETGITSPLIDYVKNLSDASILINDAALTDQGNGDYYYEESTNKLVGGNAYMMRVTATIDGSTRIFKQQLGRDSV